MKEADALERGPAIINVALTGMVPTKTDNPAVPITAQEVAQDAAAVVAAGASIIHLHPRDRDGHPTTDPGIYRDFVAAVREACPRAIISATCSGREVQDIDARAVPLNLAGDLRPELASLTCGSMNFPRQASVNAPETVVELARRMGQAGIKPEVEVFEPGMIHYAAYLLRKGELEAPLLVNILLGNLGTSPGTALDLAMMVNALPEGTVWCAAGIGRYQLNVTALALAMGGGVRVGLEDNLLYDWRAREPASNVMLVERVVRIAAELGRRPASPEETRQALGLALAPAPGGGTG